MFSFNYWGQITELSAILYRSWPHRAITLWDFGSEALVTFLKKFQLFLSQHFPLQKKSYVTNQILIYANVKLFFAAGGKLKHTCGR
jgi:hypothetical protein